MTNPSINDEPERKEEKPQVVIKEQKYSLLRTVRNVIILMLLFGAIYYFSPFEVVSVSGDSMHPTLPVGSVSIAVKTNEDTEYKVGDIITFSVNYNGTYYSRVTHRIVAIDGDTIQTKGDKNPENDPFTIQSSQIRNVVKWINIFRLRSYAQ